MIKAKEGKCLDCSKVTKLTAKRCYSCYWKYRSKVKDAQRSERGEMVKQKKIHIIPKESNKRRSQNILYHKKRRIFIDQNKNCQARLNGCTNLATDLHHKAGRTGELLTNERYFLSLCRNCHTYIEENPIFSKENGFSVSRLDFF